MSERLQAGQEWDRAGVKVRKFKNAGAMYSF